MFGRSRRVEPAPEPGPVDPEALERATSEGLLIARAAAVVALANRIIVEALHEGRPFEHDRTAQEARVTLRALADEQLAQRERIAGARAKALRAKGRSRHQHDYRPKDDGALWFREQAYVAVAERLRLLADDDDHVDGLVADAVDRAWGDVGSAVVLRARTHAVADARYEEGREERVRLLLDDDLAALRHAHVERERSEGRGRAERRGRSEARGPGER